MGYRSEVIFAVTPAAAPAFMALLAKYPEVKDMCHEADEFYSGYQEEGDWFMMWSGIKWYDGYPNVDTIESFIDPCALEEAHGRWQREDHLRILGGAFQVRTPGRR